MIGYALKNGWHYEINGKYWYKNNIKFKHMHWPIIEIFDFNQYGFINVKDREVVDVGAFVGDSSIYFALRGAKRVYAVEPHPGAYAEMLENIKLNNMQDKIIPINTAIGGKQDTIKVLANIDIVETMGMYHGFKGTNGIEIQTTTLKHLINDYRVNPDILKMDCEGCEYDVIMNDYEDVRKFKELIIEIHVDKDSQKKLLNKLNIDYTCTTRITLSKHLKIIHCINQ